MAVFNGADHIAEQIDSIEAQGHPNIDVWVSDDGSSDQTLDILQSYQESWSKGHFDIKKGPQQGFAANFLSLACDPTIQADFFAYSDQDDIWLRDKLTRALRFLEEHTDKPALYCSRTSLVDESGKPFERMSPLFKWPPSFANALVQSLAGGNTMVMNDKARALLVRVGPQDIVSHDWWTYMLVSGAGGEVLYDPEPTVLYRQHSNNEIGANTGYFARLKRLSMLMKGSFSEWNERHINSLGKVRDLLHPASQKTLDAFKIARETNVLRRLNLLRKSGVYRQTSQGNMALWIAAILGKI
jgi:glycosyltransferase involved in cell wall biosynthesis